MISEGESAHMRNAITKSLLNIWYVYMHTSILVILRFLKYLESCSVFNVKIRSWFQKPGYCSHHVRICMTSQRLVIGRLLVRLPWSACPPPSVFECMCELLYVALNKNVC